MPKRKRKKDEPCEHSMFDTLGGDRLCALGCGLREVNVADELKHEGFDKRARMEAARSGNDAELLAMLEGEDV
jgi:hypothetical protein